MNQKQANSMATMYHFLKSVKDVHFDLSVVVEGDLDTLYDEEPACGTAACVYGYFPVVYPERYVYDHFECDVSLKRDNNICMEAAVAKEWGITLEEVCSLIFESEYDTLFVKKSAVLERMRIIASNYGWEIA